MFDNILADKTVTKNPQENEVASEKADEEEKKAEKANKDELRIDDPGPSSPRLYLAILFFLKNYTVGPLHNLPGVEKDEKEQTEVLKTYQQKVINSSKNILNDLKEIVEDCKQKKFERIHFHFSGEQSIHKHNAMNNNFLFEISKLRNLYQVTAKIVSEF